MFVLLFRFIYANQFTGPAGGLDYVQFLMPGIFVQNAIFGATTTAIGLADDLKKGLIDRFRSLPMARSAVLAGRTTSDLAKNFLLVLIVIGDRLPRRVPVHARGRARGGPRGAGAHRRVRVLVDLRVHRSVR